MARGIKTTIETFITKITYPATGTVRYIVSFEGKVPFRSPPLTSLVEARKLKADHIAAHPEVLPLDPEARRLKNIERAKTTKVPGTRFIEEYVTRPGTYSVRIGRAKKFGAGKTFLIDTVVGLTAAKTREKELITEMEKLTGRGIDVLESRPIHPNYVKALADVKTQMKKYNKLGYYPDDMLVKISDKYNFPYVKAEGANRQLVNLVQDAGLINRNKLQELSPKYFEAVESYKNYKGDKTKVGVKKAILDKAGLPAKASEIGVFRGVLNRLGVHVKEVVKLPKTTRQREISKRLGKVSALNIEAYLGGGKLGPLEITGKKGSLLSKMHLAEKKGLITVGEMGFGSSKLNTMLGSNFKGTVGPEKHRTSLNRHISDIIKKYKGKPDALYLIGKGPDSFDQRKFKSALQKVFGKTQGKVSLAKYLDQIVNAEVQLMGYATDGLITTRRVDPITLERMIPPANLSGTRTLTPVGKIKDLTTLQELGLEKQQAGPKRVTPALKDFNVSANLAFQDAKINIAEFKNRINPYQMKAVVRSIEKMLGEGLQNQAYENISNLSKQCRLLRAKGGRVDFAQGGPCVAAKRAIQNLDNGEFIKIGSKIEEGATGVLGKIKNVSGRFLSLLGKGGARVAPLAAVAAVGALAEPLVKQFRSDDYSTYLSDPEQQKGMLLSMLEAETPKVDQEILKWKYPGEVGAVAAGAIPGAGEVYKARRALRPQKLPGQPAFIGPMPKGVGPARAALGIKGVLGKALGASFSPLAVAATLPLTVAAQRSGGTDYSDIATDPMNWMGPAFASTGAEMATKGIKNPMLLRALRLGFSPGALRMGSRFLGLPGLALTGGMWAYDKWKDRDKDDEFKVRKYTDDED